MIAVIKNFLEINNFTYLADNQIEQLYQYIILLLKWNKTYSLTATTDIDTVLKRHILDGLALSVNFNNSQEIILDIGTGMGVPAIILAIIFPKKQIIAVDSKIKKIIFLRQVAIELKLKNIVLKTLFIKENEHGDIKKKSVQIITARAFADIKTIITLTADLLEQNGYWLLLNSKTKIDAFILENKQNFHYQEISSCFSDININILKIYKP